MSDLESEILADWSRLGVLWNVPAARRTPDVESLIVRSLACIPRNPRMLVLVCSWLAVYWRCVGRDRLITLVSVADPAAQATAGLILQTVDAWLPTPVFEAGVKRLASASPARPLFEVDRARPALARLAEMEASPVSRQWGLWCLAVERKHNAIRPTAWTLEKNPRLKQRALFKGALKTSILAAIGAGIPTSATALSRACGVTRKAVYDALEDLRFAGLVAGIDGRDKRLASRKSCQPVRNDM